MILVASWILNLISTHHPIRPKWMLTFSKWMLNHVYYYLARAMGYVSFQKKESWQESFLNLNNEIVLSQARDVSHKNILLLLPHCLQILNARSALPETSTSVRIAVNATSRASKRWQPNTIESGGRHRGSLARKLIKDQSPNVIVAGACHRDLTDGVRDAWQVPVYAVLNERPNGPVSRPK